MYCIQLSTVQHPLKTVCQSIFVCLISIIELLSQNSREKKSQHFNLVKERKKRGQNNDHE